MIGKNITGTQKSVEIHSVDSRRYTYIFIFKEELFIPTYTLPRNLKKEGELKHCRYNTFLETHLTWMHAFQSQ